MGFGTDTLTSGDMGIVTTLELTKQGRACMGLGYGGIAMGTNVAETLIQMPLSEFNEKWAQFFKGWESVVQLYALYGVITQHSLILIASAQLEKDSVYSR